MTEDLYTKIYRILEKKQLSISGISRELKAEGFDEHRLILTGYLRALRDMNKLNEVEIPPSKIYVCVEGSETLDNDLYSMMAKHLHSLDPDSRFPVAVCILSSIFERPIFKEELKIMGVNDPHIRKHRSSLVTVKETTGKDIRDLRRSIKRIKVPDSDPAYEVDLNSTTDKLNELTNSVLIALTKDMSDLSGLVPKTKQVTLI
ncbi:hypothetical protein [Methanococcoides methylutens]|uniref:Uncharacterized protein n=1 Tax=Methanococcoides methylutens MM1 TaxID=1434104 RepID=A0A0E3X0I0_METMT|nr:hypothetical protein [Methanococcoides methylutens]AKB85900.1 hypothetical protein MCMEM_1847 [Methanococcoides methylutens MM1]